MPVGTKISPRHLRHRKRSRVRRSKDFKKFITDLQTVLNATGAAKTFTATIASKNLTATAHGFSVGAGPFLLTSTTTLPSGAPSGKLVWVVEVPDANNVRIATSPRGAAITMADAGTGTHTMTKASSLDAVFNLLKRRGINVMKAATDVDGI